MLRINRTSNLTKEIHIMKTYQLIATFTLLASLQSFAGVQKNCLDDKQVATARLLDLSGAIKNSNRQQIF